MATATETIELHQREIVDVPKDDRSDTDIVGSQQTWKVPSINKYRVPVTFWSLAVRGKLEVFIAYLLDIRQNSMIRAPLLDTLPKTKHMLIAFSNAGHRHERCILRTAASIP
jgi:hypothetical protein